MKFSSAMMMVLCPATISNAFTFNALNVPSPVLDKFVHDTAVIKKPFDTGTLLDVQLDIGKDDESRLSLSGATIELFPDNISKNQAKQYAGLPGANGPNPKSSTGAKHLTVTSPPSFIDMAGKQFVNLEKGAWEIVWRDNSPSGSLICGFLLPESYQRNEALLPKGRLYISFPVWTTESLQEQLVLKHKAEKRGSKFLQEKEDAMLKYQTESNFFKKAMHYREALSAAEHYSLVPLYKNVPQEADTMVLQDDLLLSTKGTAWTKKDGGMFGEHKQVLLGSASISPSVTVEEVIGNLRP